MYQLMTSTCQYLISDRWTPFSHLFTLSWLNMKIIKFLYNGIENIENVLDKGHAVTVELMGWKFPQMWPRNRIIFFQFPSSYIYFLFWKIACKMKIFVIIFVNCLTKGCEIVLLWHKRIKTLFFMVNWRTEWSGNPKLGQNVLRIFCEIWLGRSHFLRLWPW